MQNIHNIDGCDLEHWFVVMEPPPGDLDDPDVPREEIIDSYIKVLSKVVGRYNINYTISSSYVLSRTQMHLVSKRVFNTHDLFDPMIIG